MTGVASTIDGPGVPLRWSEPARPASTAWFGTLAARHPTLVQLARYAVIGGLGTAANALLYLPARDWLPAVPANLVALVLSTALSTEANRRFTFGGATRRRWRSSVQDLGTVAFYAGYSSLVLLGLLTLVPTATPTQEALAVAVASLFGGLLRFAVLRFWVFAPVRG